MRRMPHGVPRAAMGSDVNVTGRSQRRVIAGGRSSEERMALLRRVMSAEEAYMLPELIRIGC